MYDSYLPEWTAREYHVNLASNLEELASQSDFVAILTPLELRDEKVARRTLFQGNEACDALYQLLSRRHGG